MINAYLVKIINRKAQTPAQKAFADLNPFLSLRKALDFRGHLISDEVGFLPAQVRVFNVDMKILSEMRLDDGGNRDEPGSGTGGA